MRDKRRVVGLMSWDGGWRGILAAWLPRGLMFVLGAIAASAQAAKPEVGDVPSPPDAYEYVDGSTVDLAQLRGSPAVLYFGGDWCIPCQETRPYVLKLAREHPGKLHVVFFSSDDNRDRPAKLAESQGAAYRIAMPRLQRVPPGSLFKGLKDAGAFGSIYIFPTAFVLDADGRVVYKMERGMGIRNQLPGLVERMLR